ncbi:hypothetical protein [Streptomyces spiramyceticus]|uniref:hypothetical protein n=1 Tax=Streptomyces spiramyceticus TaxID=299717 RepID=UPI00237C28A3|nr:hypothetical protein [Streptomyces spiramyceticus]
MDGRLGQDLGQEQPAVRGKNRLAVSSGHLAVGADAVRDGVDGGLVGVVGAQAVPQVPSAQPDGPVEFVDVTRRVEVDRGDRAGVFVQRIEELQFHGFLPERVAARGPPG